MMAKCNCALTKVGRLKVLLLLLTKEQKFRVRCYTKDFMTYVESKMAGSLADSEE